jgi:hypothetical protein
MQKMAISGEGRQSAPLESERSKLPYLLWL